jgi:glycosyltransferase involved in cell wall biosynthesis
MGAWLAANERYDLVFAPTAIIHQLFAWLWLLLRHRSKIGCAVLLIRMGPTEPNDVPGDPICDWNVRLLRRCLRLFRPFHRAGRVRFATDSEALAAEYRDLSGLPFSVYPSPMHQPAPAAEPERTERGPLRLGVLGTPAYIKGIDVALEAIRLLRDDPPDAPLRFVVQWAKQEARAVGREPLRPDESLEREGWVEYVRRDLPVVEYGALLRSLDAVVLPYRVDPYRLRTSGVIVEAMTAGLPVIVTAGTTLEEGMRTCGAGLSVADGDARDLAARIRELVADAAKHRARARARIAAARAHHAPERFQALLWGELA